MANINRDYLVILDVKSGELSGSTQMYFYNTDKNTSNIYVQLVIKETTVDATPIENATNYIVESKIVKPGPVFKDLTGVLVNEAEAIYEFDLPNDCTNLSGSYKIEFWVKAKVADKDELITSSKAKYKVKKSILTDLDEAIEDSTDYPLLLQLMEEVRVINATAHELDTQIRTLQADMITANEEMKTNEATRQANEATRQSNEATRITQESARQEYLNTFDAKWEEYKTNTSNDIANYKSQIDAQEIIRETNEEQRKANEATRVANENERKAAENQRKANEEVRAFNEVERKANEASRVAAENTRAANEEVRQTNEANREAAEEIRKANEEARITAETARVTEHEQMRTELNEVKAENAILMENDKKVADRMTQVEISDKRQYVIMEGLMNSAGDGYLKIENTGNDTTLYNSVEGFVDVKNITGNTMVNSIKNPDDELTLNADINTSGQTVTLTTAVDNGQVDVLAEGNTMVNVCDQQEAVAITKSYTVETGNHIALQGEYDGKCRPVIYGNTLVNLIQKRERIDLNKNTSTGAMSLLIPNKLNTEYTMIINLSNLNLDGQAEIALGIRGYTIDGIFSSTSLDTTKIKDNFIKLKWIETEKQFKNILFGISGSVNANNPTFTFENVMILEGDYTNKPLPDYFTGMQSSFEDKVVTQEMVDSGKELAENLGKYRTDYKVTGKNKFDINLINPQDAELTSAGFIVRKTTNWACVRIAHFKLKKHTDYIFNFKVLVKSGKANFAIRDDVTDIEIKSSSTISPSTEWVEKKLTWNSGNRDKITLCFYSNFSSSTIDEADVEFKNIQIEEGSTATPYEPYKEQIKTYYLNSPLLEGDTIEDNGNDVVHVHRYCKVVLDGSDDENITLNSSTLTNTMIFSNIITGTKSKGTVMTDKFIWEESIADKEHIWSGNNNLSIHILKSKLSSQDVNGFRAWLQSNPVTAVYELASPTREVISQNDSILQDSYKGGHLDVDTAVPIDKVEFNGWISELKYLYPSTNYMLQFESDNIGELSFNLGSTLLNQQIIKGINKFNITTPSSMTNTNMFFTGIGFNASNIVATEATDKDFGYFKGMKSVGEQEGNKIEILSSNKNLLCSFNSIEDLDNCKYLIKNTGYITNATISNNSIIIDTSNWGNIVTSASIDYFLTNLKPNSTYTLSCKVTGLLSGRIYAFFIGSLYKDELDSEGNWTRTFATDNLGIPKNSGDKRGINFPNAYATCEDTVTISNIQLVEGDTASNYIPHAENKKQILLNEPLRAVGNVKDRFVKVGNKWLIERNTGSIIIDGSENTWGNKGYGGHETRNTFECNFKYLGTPNLVVPAISDRYNCELVSGIPVNDNAFRAYTIVNSTNNIPYTYFLFTPSTSLIPYRNLDAWKTYLSNNPVTIIYQLAQPTYEPIEIAPTLNTYTDVTHITNNSTIPMNMPIVNSGYEIIAKPNTKYTVVGITNGRIGDNTIVNGTITTPATITDNFLRPYGTGTTSKVMLLEGEPANIPAYFKGIKSVFEDQLITEGENAGKYACEVKVVGKNKFNSSILKDCPIATIQGNNIILNGTLSNHWWFKVTLPKGTYTPSGNDPSTRIHLFYDGYDNGFVIDRVFTYDSEVTLNGYITRGTYDNYIISNLQIEQGNTATEYEPYHETKQTLYLDEPLYNANNITIYNDKLGYWKNWDKVVLNGNWNDDGINNYGRRIATNNIRLPKECSIDTANNASFISPKFLMSTDPAASNITLNSMRLRYADNTYYFNCVIPKSVTDINKYMKDLEIVYQLAEPVFVPLIDNCPNWVIGSWDNCSIHFDSIIPLLSTRYRYTGNVPSVVAMSDDVAETKSISDEQDAMIVDLATNVAVMEMMLM